MNIGVTGHQELPEDLTFDWVDGELEKALNKFRNISHAFSSLAAGSDQFFAKKVLKLNLNLVGIIPCLHYEDTFNEKNKILYFSFLSQCEYIETLNFNEPTEEAFFSAGKYIVNNSDVLFAIWDGQRAKGLGGTGDVVEYALSLKKSIIHFDIIRNRTINHNL